MWSPPVAATVPADGVDEDRRASVVGQLNAGGPENPPCVPAAAPADVTSRLLYTTSRP